MNFYEVLEIDSRASASDIERAYRVLARKVHPDLNAGDAGKAEARMKQLNEIRDTLTDPLLRAGYDERLRLEALQHAREAAARPAAAPTPARAPQTGARAEASTAPDDERRRHMGPIVLAFGAAMVAGILYVSLREPRPSPVTPEAPAEPAPSTGPGPTPASAAAPQPLAPPLPPSSLTVPVPRPRPGADPRGLATSRTLAGPRGPFRGRGVVRIGSTTEQVMRVLGPPDSVDTGAEPGDAVLHYGHLRLEMKNGRVTGGDAPAR